MPCTIYKMFMKKQTISFLAVTVIVSSFFFSCGSNKVKQYGNMEFDSIKIDKTVALIDNDTASPSCNLRIDYVYPVKSDSMQLMDSVNQTLLHYCFGEPYKNMNTIAAIDSFENSYIKEYRADLQPLYLEDLKNSNGDNSVGAWYSYYQSIEARPSTENPEYLVYIINTSSYRGGAHGMYGCQFLNFNPSNGHLMTLNDVFKANYKKTVNELLLNKLMKDTGSANLEELEDKAYLQDTDIYPSNNFRLGKDSIYFFYNVYEIAPYSSGTTEIALSYDSLKGLLKIRE